MEYYFPANVTYLKTLDISTADVFQAFQNKRLQLFIQPIYPKEYCILFISVCKYRHKLFLIGVIDSLLLKGLK